MTTYSLTLSEAVYLKTALENPKIKEMYDGLVKNLMQVADMTEVEAKQAIFPEFLSAIRFLANNKMEQSA